jgi:O-antigen biosynthesis protein
MNKRQRVCIVSPEIVGPHKNGGIGTHCYYLSAFLSQQLKQDVTFLHTGIIEQQDEVYWHSWFKKNLGVEFVSINAQTAADATSTPPAGLKSYYGQVARHVYRRVREGNFEVVHFQEMLGNGFRCFQAKKMGQAFQHTILTCTVHSSWEWICQAMQSFPQLGYEELQAKYMERYSIENCDLLMSPSEYMLQWVDANQLKATAPRRVLPYLFDPELRPAGYKPAANHIIFFGRLEVRKGLLVFLQALLDLDRHSAFAGRELKVTFLGRSGYTPDGSGRESIEKFRQQYSTSIWLEIETELGHHEALKYLTVHNDALVVCPSLIDNSPYAVIESLQLGLNIIAARSGGIPELFAGSERLFDPDAPSLAAKIQAGLKNELPPPAKRYDLAQAQKLWGDFCGQLHPEPAREVSHGKRSADAKLAVYVGAGSEPAVTATLQALEGQKAQNFSVSIVPADKDSLRPALAPDLLAMWQKRDCNLLDTKAVQDSWTAPAAPYALFVLPGCSLAPQAIGQLLEAMESNPKLDALTCFLDVSSDYNGRIAFSYEPLGPCLEGGMLYNYFGSGCVLLRTVRLPKSLPSLQKLVCPEGIWGLLAQLAIGGQCCDVLPNTLGAWKNPGHAFSFAELDYSHFLPVLDSYTVGKPLWLRYFLLHGISSERRFAGPVQGAHEREAGAGSKENPTVAYKIRRETRRIIRQCQSLFNREDGA